jgi:hypothetical protein
VLTTGPAHAASSVTFADGVLSIQGDAASNSLNVGSTAVGVITLNGVAVLDGQATVDNVQILGMDGGEGNDTLRIDASIPAKVAGKLVGGPGNDTLIGGSGDDIVDLGPDADADQFTWKAGEGNDVMVDGGGQTDTLRVIGSDGSDSLNTDTNINDPSQAFAQLTGAGQGSEFLRFTGFEAMKILLGAGGDSRVGG